MLDQRATVPPIRDEFIRDLAPAQSAEIVRQLPTMEWLGNITWIRRSLVIVLLALAWELSSFWTDNPLMFPRFSEVCIAFWEEMVYGPLLARTATTLRVLMLGYSIGLAFAAIFVVFAVLTRFGDDVLSTLTAMFNPLPSIALLPLALLWLGLGTPSMVFIMVHAVLWAVALNTHTGFRSVSETLRMVGQNYGLRGWRYILYILLPAASPSILAGLRIGWAFSWRTLIAAELIFGVSSRSGGLGWYIFENRNMLQTPNVFAGLLTVIIIGLLIETVIFRVVEARTVRKWGMQR